VQSFADAMLVIPKTLAQNSGFDTVDALLTIFEVRLQPNIP
jgi:T-complex protein 1 subunit zeta